jgi:hypothetical protein
MCVWKNARVREKIERNQERPLWMRGREIVCVCGRERERVCVCERKREKNGICVNEIEKETESVRA